MVYTIIFQLAVIDTYIIIQKVTKRFGPDFVTEHSEGSEIRDTKTLNLSRNIVALQVLVDVSRFSSCVINLTTFFAG